MGAGSLWPQFSGSCFYFFHSYPCPATGKLTSLILTWTIGLQDSNGAPLQNFIHRHTVDQENLERDKKKKEKGEFT